MIYLVINTTWLKIMLTKFRYVQIHSICLLTILIMNYIHQNATIK